jgi:thymidylate synthase
LNKEFAKCPHCGVSVESDALCKTCEMQRQAELEAIKNKYSRLRLEPAFDPARIFTLRAPTVNDLWFRVVYHILETNKNGEFIHAYKTGSIQKGSFEGEQSRLQFPGIALMVEYPNVDYIVKMPEGSNIPAPTDDEKVHKYFEEYILGHELKENETYTYGQRINISLWGILEILKASPVTNQAIVEIGRPEDWFECKGKDGKDDPPCLRLIDFKVIPAYDENGKLIKEKSKLTMSVYFRSWDLYGGMPENLGGLSLLQQFVSDEIGIPVGPLYCYSSGLHLYRYQKELAELRTRISCPEY